MTNIGHACGLKMPRPYIARQFTYQNQVSHKPNRTLANWIRFIIIVSVIIFLLSLLVSFYVDSKQKVELAEVTVLSGDTLWSIAKNYSTSNGDIREFIYSIQKLNQLTSARIYPGQVILIPLME